MRVNYTLWLEVRVPDHPQYAMWKARLETEQEAERARAARRTARNAEREGWDAAWVHYRRLWHEAFLPGRALPPWWHARAWLRILFGKPG